MVHQLEYTQVGSQREGSRGDSLKRIGSREQEIEVLSYG